MESTYFQSYMASNENSLGGSPCLAGFLRLTWPRFTSISTTLSNKFTTKNTCHIIEIKRT